MRNIFRSLVFASAALCASAAFAADKAVVNVPFNFEIHGKQLPAGRYAATLDSRHNMITLSSTTDTHQSMTWVVSPAESDSSAPMLCMKFDDAGYIFKLHTIQLGPHITSVLDAPTKRHDAGSLVAVVSGQ
jgi:hypothetical protein